MGNYLNRLEPVEEWAYSFVHVPPESKSGSRVFHAGFASRSVAESVLTAELTKVDYKWGRIKDVKIFKLVERFEWIDRGRATAQEVREFIEHG